MQMHCNEADTYPEPVPISRKLSWSTLYFVMSGVPIRGNFRQVLDSIWCIASSTSFSFLDEAKSQMKPSYRLSKTKQTKKILVEIYFHF